MAKTVLNVKTDVDVKREAQSLAKKIGVPLSMVVNAQLKQFIANRKIEFGEIHLPPLSLEEIARRAEPVFKKYGITRAGVFGSYARGEARADSDIDLLVTYGKPLGFGHSSVREDLEEALGHDVDIVSEKAVIPYFRESIYRDLKPLYEN